MPQMFPSFILLLSALVWGLFLFMMMIFFWLNLIYSKPLSNFKSKELSMMFNQIW